MTIQPASPIEPSAVTPLPPPIVVASAAHLRQVVQTLRDAHRVAVDTESNSLYVYRERVCLIQLSTDQADFLIDPLRFAQPGDLSPLGELFANPRIEKVFHAAEYDIMGLRRDFSFAFSNLFDTMIAARVLGWQNFGLGAILQERFGVQVDKSHQRANWTHRPLPAEQIAYAQIDTHYLLSLRDELDDLLSAGGLQEEAREMFAGVCQAEWHGGVFDPDGFWKLNGARALSPPGMAILKELYLYREHQAERRDLPVFKVLSDAALVSIAAAAPQNLRDLTAVGLSERLIRVHGQAILKSVREGLHANPPTRKRHEATDEASLRRFDELHLWRKKRALERSVPSDIIVSREALWAIAREAPDSLSRLEALGCLGPWRLRTYGEEILKVLVDAQQHL